MTKRAISPATAVPSLKDTEWLKRPETCRVFAALSGNGVETRAVGGAVRNTLLGQSVKEIDLATTARPEQVIALAKKAGLKPVPTGIEHGTVTVIADGVPFEVTTLRSDVETFGRHDPCVGIRATPIAEAMLALVLMDHLMRQRAQNPSWLDGA